MNWQKVHTVHGYYDAPRFGVADYDGQPHIYESPFDESSDDYSETYLLSPIGDDLFDLILRDWAIWERRLAAFNAGDAPEGSHPCLKEDKPEHDKLTNLIGDGFQINRANCITKRATFRKVSDSPRRLEVNWSSCD